MEGIGLGLIGVLLLTGGMTAREDPKDVVRRGYDALSYRYRGDTEEPEHYATWLARLRERVPAGGAVLDLGCGCGVPLARDLAAGGYEVTGVDLSAVQVERARRLVPVGRFLHADAATYRGWIEQAGLVVVAQEVVPEGDGAHALFWARR
jgi:SAM-dependent methyltransferase